jgi:hypothetical protein
MRIGKKRNLANKTLPYFGVLYHPTESCDYTTQFCLQFQYVKIVNEKTGNFVIREITS